MKMIQSPRPIHIGGSRQLPLIQSLHISPGHVLIGMNAAPTVIFVDPGAVASRQGSQEVLARRRKSGLGRISRAVRKRQRTVDAAKQAVGRGVALKTEPCDFDPGDHRRVTGDGDRCSSATTNHIVVGITIVVRRPGRQGQARGRRVGVGGQLDVCFPGLDCGIGGDLACVFPPYT